MPEARRRVAVELGLAQVREEVRDVWLTRWLRDFLYDLRFSARSFLRSPGFTARDAALAGPRHRRHHRHLFAGRSGDPARAPRPRARAPGSRRLERATQVTNAFGSYNLMSYPICRDLQQQTRFFDGVLCRAEIHVNLSAGGDPKPVAAEIVSGSYFPVLGVGPALGRVIEDRGRCRARRRSRGRPLV